MNELATHDMYGNEIYRLGETGYGVSLCLYSSGGGDKLLMPQFTFFHVSDGFRQCLFSAELRDPPWLNQHLAGVLNVFDTRITELLATEPHGRS